MLTLHSSQSPRYCDGLSRRGFLKAGSLAVAGLTLPNLLQLKAQGAINQNRRAKSVIMVCLGGGPSQLDTYDMKPDAPAEFRGELQPIRSSVPGMEMCNLLPLQAKIAHRFSVVKTCTWIEPDHQRIEIFTGYPKKQRRPSFGSYVSRFYKNPPADLPRFASLQGNDGEIAEAEQPLWVGAEHRSFCPAEGGTKSLEIGQSLTLDRMRDRKDLLTSLDRIRRDVDSAGQMNAFDAYTGQALDMLTSGRARKAFDLSDESPATLDRYKAAGTMFKYYRHDAYWDWQAFVRARRLAEAGVPFISLQVGTWDHHCDASSGSIFESYHTLLPLYDQCLSALINDLHDRGLDKDVCVVAWGEFGRTPRLNNFGGRDHWPGVGCVLFSGGGLKMGQYVGTTNSLGEYPTSRAYSPQNILATLYHVLGIDPTATVPDHNGRPQYLLDDRDPVAELI